MDVLSQGATTLREIGLQTDGQQQVLSKTLERLSSGLRINQTSDDAAGSALASKSENASRLYTAAISNIGDGISAINVASSGLDELSTLTTRMQELAQQATSSALSSSQRTALDNEAQSLKDDFNRIAASTEFNGTRLLTGSMQSISVQAGITSNTGYDVSLGNEAAAVDFQATVTEEVYDGTFSAVNTMGFGSVRNDIDTGDFNGDGKADLVNVGSVGSNASVRVRLGNGDGTFVTSATYTIPALVGSINGSDVVVGNFDTDAINDLVAVSYGGTQAQISFLKGNSDGTFGPAQSVLAGSQLRGFSVAKGDFDKDGDLDVIVTHASDYTAALFKNGGDSLGNGDGSFGAAIGISGGYGYGSPSVADFNSDGNLDFVGGSDTGTAAVLKSNADGTFQAPVNLLTTGGFVHTTAVADFDGDGDVDIVASNNVTSSVGVFLNNGDATFSARVDYATGAPIFELEVADLTQDGVMDIVATGATSIYTLVGTGTGTFGALKSVASGATISVGTVLADFDGDSVNDIASIEYGGSLNVHLSTPSLQTTDSDFSLLTVARATGALTMFGENQDSLTLQKGKLAAGLSRLEVCSLNAEAMRINLDSAVAAIRDIDVVTELTVHLQAKILTEANSALFAHSENLSKNVAGLLQA